MNIALCFAVRNCGKYLNDVFKNIELLKTLDINIFSIFVYDNCSDNSEQLLLEYKTKNKDKDNIFIEKIINNSPLRTVRIAKARNKCLEILYNKLKNISFHIVIDCDNVGAPKWNMDIINKYLHNFDGDNWDCISFNKNSESKSYPYYYDIWALLYDDFKEHCYGYTLNKCLDVVYLMRRDITRKLEQCKSNSIEVMSAFNGFAIYKTERFKGFYYDGLYKNFKPLITDAERNKTIETLKKYNIHTELAQGEKCGSGEQVSEHLFYHVSALNKGRKIKISKFIIN